MKDRLKELRKTQGLKQREFAERVGVSTGRVGGWESGTDRPGDARIDKICNVFHVRREWLEKGEGEMFEPEQAPKSKDEVLREAAYALFSKLPKDAQEAVLAAMKDVIASETKPV